MAVSTVGRQAITEGLRHRLMAFSESIGSMVVEAVRTPPSDHAQRLQKTLGTAVVMEREFIPKGVRQSGPCVRPQLAECLLQLVPRQRLIVIEGASRFGVRKVDMSGAVRVPDAVEESSHGQAQPGVPGTTVVRLEQGEMAPVRATLASR